MDKRDIHRKARLRELIDGPRFNGNRGSFCTATNLSKSRVSQLLDPDAAFGERVAKTITDRLRLGDGWFELAEGIERQLTVVEKRDDRLAAIMELPGDMQDAILKIVSGLRRNTAAKNAKL